MASENNAEEYNSLADSRKKVDMSVHDGAEARSELNLRASLAWDSSFFSNPGVLELEELMATLNLQEFETKELRGKNDYNVRNSLAWDNAFFTSPGVLDAEELCIVNSGFKKSAKRRGIKEEMRNFAVSTSKAVVGSYSLSSVEIDLLDDLSTSAHNDPSLIYTKSMQNKPKQRLLCIANGGTNAAASSAGKRNTTQKRKTSPLNSKTPPLDNGPKKSPLIHRLSALKTPLKQPLVSTNKATNSLNRKPLYLSKTSSTMKQNRSQAPNLVSSPLRGSFDAVTTPKTPKFVGPVLRLSSPKMSASGVRMPSPQISGSGLRMPSPKIGYFDVKYSLENCKINSSKNREKASSRKQLKLKSDVAEFMDVEKENMAGIANGVTKKP